MSTYASVERSRERALFTLHRLEWLPLLVARVCVGLLFVVAGFEKLSDLTRATQNFAHIGIGAPGFFAPFVGTFELICGALLVVGLFSRLATVPLFAVMLVALFTAKLPHVHSLGGFLGLEELLLMLVLFALFVFGPGKVAIDELLDRRVRAAHRGFLFATTWRDRD